jgi:hypothetical protein
MKTFAGEIQSRRRAKPRCGPEPRGSAAPCPLGSPFRAAETLRRAIFAMAAAEGTMSSGSERAGAGHRRDNELSRHGKLATLTQGRSDDLS